MKDRAEEILIELGITPDEKGFYYLADAISLINQRTGLVEIYKLLAKKFYSSQTGVERSIRYCVYMVDDDTEAYKKYIMIPKNRLTNGKFIHLIRYRIEKEEKWK